MLFHRLAIPRLINLIEHLRACTLHILFINKLNLNKIVLNFLFQAYSSGAPLITTNVLYSSSGVELRQIVFQY